MGHFAYALSELMRITWRKSPSTLNEAQNTIYYDIYEITIFPCNTRIDAFSAVNFIHSKKRDCFLCCSIRNHRPYFEKESSCTNSDYEESLQLFKISSKVV